MPQLTKTKLLDVKQIEKAGFSRVRPSTGVKDVEVIPHSQGYWVRRTPTRTLRPKQPRRFKARTPIPQRQREQIRRGEDIIFTEQEIREIHRRYTTEELESIEGAMIVVSERREFLQEIEQPRRKYKRKRFQESELRQLSTPVLRDDEGNLHYVVDNKEYVVARGKKIVFRTEKITKGKHKGKYRIVEEEKDEGRYRVYQLLKNGKRKPLSKEGFAREDMAWRSVLRGWGMNKKDLMIIEQEAYAKRRGLSKKEERKISIYGVDRAPEMRRQPKWHRTTNYTYNKKTDEYELSFGGKTPREVKLDAKDSGGIYDKKTGNWIIPKNQKNSLWLEKNFKERESIGYLSPSDIAFLSKKPYFIRQKEKREAKFKRRAQIKRERRPKKKYYAIKGREPNAKILKRPFIDKIESAKTPKERQHIMTEANYKAIIKIDPDRAKDRKKVRELYEQSRTEVVVETDRQRKIRLEKLKRLKT